MIGSDRPSRAVVDLLYNQHVPDPGGNAVSLQPKPTWSFDDRLEGERSALEGRSEYVGGEAYDKLEAGVV